MAQLGDRGLIAVPSLVRCQAHPRKGVHGLRESCFMARPAQPGETVEQKQDTGYWVMIGTITGVSAAVLIAVGVAVLF